MLRIDVACEIVNPIDACRLSIADVSYVIDMTFGAGQNQCVPRKRIDVYPSKESGYLLSWRNIQQRYSLVNQFINLRKRYIV